MSDKEQFDAYIMVIAYASNGGAIPSTLAMTKDKCRKLFYKVFPTQKGRSWKNVEASGYKMIKMNCVESD